MELHVTPEASDLIRRRGGTAAVDLVQAVS